MKKTELYGNLLVLFTTIIYGVNTPVMKTVMPEWIDGWALSTVRQVFAAVAFWITSFFIPAQKIQKKHLLYMIGGGFFGLAMNQIPYALGLTLGSPVDSSILRSSTPVVVILLALLIYKQKVTARLIFSVLLGIAGAVLIIVLGGNVPGGHPHFDGNLLVMLSILSYSFYLVLIKPVAGQYHVVHIMKWMFLSAAVITLPFSYTHIAAAKAFGASTDWSVIVRILYSCVFATYIAYMVNVEALKYITPTRESLYSYLQPVVATAVAIMLGQDKLTWIDPVALLLIFASFYLLTFRKPAKMPAGKSGRTKNPR